jgi:hypothetical protein
MKGDELVAGALQIGHLMNVVASAAGHRSSRMDLRRDRYDPPTRSCTEPGFGCAPRDNSDGAVRAPMVVDGAALAAAPAKHQRLVMISAVNHRAQVGPIVESHSLSEVARFDRQPRESFRQLIQRDLLLLAIPAPEEIEDLSASSHGASLHRCQKNARFMPPVGELSKPSEAGSGTFAAQI